jgi:hypothetical protein
MKSIGGALAFLAAVLTSPAMADNADHSANYYLPSCRDFINKQFARNPFLQGHCVGIIEGLSVTASDLASAFVVSRSCAPDNATLAQMATVVVRWFDQHPERWHEDFRSLVLLALHGAWPCLIGK